MIAIVAITIYTNYGDYEKIALGYIAVYSHRHFADVAASSGVEGGPAASTVSIVGVSGGTVPPLTDAVSPRHVSAIDLACSKVSSSFGSKSAESVTSASAAHWSSSATSF